MNVIVLTASLILKSLTIACADVPFNISQRKNSIFFCPVYQTLILCNILTLSLGNIIFYKHSNAYLFTVGSCPSARYVISISLILKSINIPRPYG